MIDDEFDDINSLVKKTKNILSKLYRRLDNLDFLERGEFSNQYSFIGSNLRMRIIEVDVNRPMIQYLIPSNHSSNYYIVTPFEEFFDMCPDDIKEKILFNLDLFR
jgi:hypothetical protein